MRVVFFGSSDYCIPILESVYNNFSLVAVVTKPDRLLSRQKTPIPTAVKQFAQKHKIKSFTPKDKNGLSNLCGQLDALYADFQVVADFGLIIPIEILNIPRLKTLNIHFSRLPQLRGASPVQYTILLGQTKTWITLLLMDEKMDTGPILWQSEVSIAKGETTESLYKKLFESAAKDLPNVLSQYTAGTLKTSPQDNTKATYTKLLSRADGYIPWEILQKAVSSKPGFERGELSKKDFALWPYLRNNPKILKSVVSYQLSVVIERAIRAFTPWPGIWTTLPLKVSPLKGKRLKILKAHLTKENGQFTLKLKLDLVQLEGKKPVTWKQFLQGYPQVSL